MEIILASLAALLPLAAIGLTTLAAFAVMIVLGLLTEMSFKRLFFVSFGLGLLAPILAGAGIASAIADGSFERNASAGLREKLSELQDISRQVETGDMTDEEAKARVEEIFSGFEDLQIRFDTDGSDAGDEAADTGVPLELPEGAESEVGGAE